MHSLYNILQEREGGVHWSGLYFSEWSVVSRMVICTQHLRMPADALSIIFCRSLKWEYTMYSGFNVSEWSVVSWMVTCIQPLRMPADALSL